MWVLECPLCSSTLGVPNSLEKIINQNNHQKNIFQNLKLASLAVEQKIQNKSLSLLAIASNLLFSLDELGASTAYTFVLL